MHIVIYSSLKDKWFRFWDDFPHMATPPPHITAIPRTLEYLRTYYQEWSYITPQQIGDLENTYKRRVNDTFRVLAGKQAVARSMRIINTLPSINWHLVWGNLPQAVVIVRYTLCDIWRSTVSRPRMWSHKAFTSCQVTSVHSVEQWRHWCTTLGVWNQCRHWDTDKRAVNYDSSHDIWTDLSVVAPLSHLQNLAAPKTLRNSMFLSLHGMLCGKKFRSLRVLNYVDFMRSTMWWVYQCKAWLNTFENELDTFCSYEWLKGLS
jgi:hypothetical protein